MKQDKAPSVGDSILQGLQDALSFSKGEPRARVRRYELVYPDVKALRSQLKLTQREFAMEFGFSLSAVRHWEQGKRVPEKSARLLLALIAKDPDLVRETMREGFRRLAAE